MGIGSLGMSASMMMMKILFALLGVCQAFQWPVLEPENCSLDMEQFCGHFLPVASADCEERLEEIKGKIDQIRRHKRQAAYTLLSDLDALGQVYSQRSIDFLLNDDDKGLIKMYEIALFQCMKASDSDMLSKQNPSSCFNCLCKASDLFSTVCEDLQGGTK